MSTQTESDIILNRANVALARSQRLVASWLPARSPDEPDNSKSEEDLRKEEDEIFTPVPETLGLGAPLPQNNPDGSWKRSELSSNEKLRRQLLGKNYKKVAKETTSFAKKPEGSNPTSSNSVTASTIPPDDTDDEEEGRTSQIGKKRKKSERTDSEQPEATASLDNAGDGSEDLPATKKAVPSAAKGKKKATSFLDEVLAERSKKRKKR
ncbi:hypothetical protein PHISCL_00287 [Aspergillus sclerotialis]|uniref:Uncharacterized protein n=1 Tax=Aspergillus sclerotialis TaxID=2070753 RepID=A0A3A3ADN2_9EURO|nr:hypothetical protein PHISCL_00287 [Aspergillus sclerotialis]